MSFFSDSSRHARRNPAAQGTDLRVLGELLELLSRIEFRKVQAWYIAGLLHMNRTHIHRAIANLERLGYVERGEKCGHAFTYRLSMPYDRRGDPPDNPLSAA